MPMPEILTRKLGPLPGWAWGGLGIGVALAVASWQKSKAESAAGDEAVTQSYDLPESLSPTYVFQNYDQDRTYIDVNTPVTVPPGGGRPPGPAPWPTPLPVPRPTPRPIPVPSTGPRTPPKPAPAPKGVWVTTIPWKPGQKPGTPSSIWGIAEQVFGVGKVSRTLTNQIWSAPQNAGLRARRQQADQIRAGDKVWVPK